MPPHQSILEAFDKKFRCSCKDGDILDEVCCDIHGKFARECKSFLLQALTSEEARLEEEHANRCFNNEKKWKGEVVQKIDNLLEIYRFCNDGTTLEELVMNLKQQLLK